MQCNATPRDKKGKTQEPRIKEQWSQRKAMKHKDQENKTVQGHRITPIT